MLLHFNKRIMNITILWSSLADYSVELFRELAEQEKCRLQIFYQSVDKKAPYDGFDLSFAEMSTNCSNITYKYLEEQVSRFTPRIILMSSWRYPLYMKLTKYMRKKGIYVISAMDNQWYGTPKQLLGVLTSKYFLKPSIDTFLVSGDRQAHFAKKLGYKEVMYGLYAADTKKYKNEKYITDRPKKFLFVGRLAAEKGIQSLIDAYLIYRNELDEPWDLEIIGTGPFENKLMNYPGVNYLGFVQPKDLNKFYNNARCFVLPSLREPWGVVIQEAASAGLPIIASYECGAITRFVFEGVNGIIINTNTESIKNAFIKMSCAKDEQLIEMSNNSVILAQLWSPSKLAKYLIGNLNDYLSTCKSLTVKY